MIRTAALLLAAIPTAALGQVMLQEGFEPGFTGAGWQVSNLLGDGDWQLDTTVHRTGQASLRLTGAVGNLYVSYDFGQTMENTTADVWFYDGLEATKETHFAVTADPNHLQTTSNHLRIGTSCAFSPGFYIVVEGHHTSGVVLGPPRTLGWHRATVVNASGVNSCYVDGTLVHTTGFQGNWNYLVLNEDNLCTTGATWFDDLLVVGPDPVATPRASWGQLKSRYAPLNDH